MKFINTKRYKKPTILFTKKAYEKVTTICQTIDIEIAWHGVVTKEKDTYIIEDILVYPQEATPVTVTSNDDDYPSWLHNLPDNIFNKIRLQGHSHVNMATTPSGTDVINRDDILTQVTDYYIFMIFNKKNSINIRLYDIKENICYEPQDIKLIIPKTWAEEEIEEYLKVEKKKYTTPTASKKTPTNNTLRKIEDRYKHMEGYYGY
jgi:hypothetical protein